MSGIKGESDMAERYEVFARVISQKGTCAHEHKVGDEWVIGGETPEGICLSAFQSLLSDLRVLMFGGSLPWMEDPDTAIVACPDPENPVVFELRRVKE